MVTDTSITNTTGTEPIRFPGFKRNVAASVGMILGGGMAFSMGLTDSFFATAIAWSFVTWGVLLLFTNLIEGNETFIVSEEGLSVHNPFRLWAMHKHWSWDKIERVDIWVRRFDPTYENVHLQVYHNAQDDLDPGTLQREDTQFRAGLASLVIEKAGLSPDGHDISDLNDLPPTQPARYKWT